MAYSEKVVEHFQKPLNVGSFGSSSDVKDRSDIGVGIVGAPECGDVMQLHIKVDEAGKIEDAKFKTFGCGENKSIFSIQIIAILLSILVYFFTYLTLKLEK